MTRSEMNPSVNGHLPYRPDLDGVRALAILPVLFFHADIAWFGGGFVGVDVFFVLSGFFMARVILNDLERGTFSFWEFYLRRARRILPALFVMIAATSTAAWFLLMPQEFEYFANSVAAAATFTSNILFENESGYFDIAAEMKPLLHTWSLSIEEQFYVFFPIALFAAYRFARAKVAHIMAGFLVASFVASTIFVFHKPEDAFYLLHFRVWELLAGSLIAVLPAGSHPDRTRQVMSLAGLAGIIASVFLFTRDMLFPGPLAAIPVLSTALIIHAAAQKGLSATLLANPLSVWIGRLSYSLYLWHWPVIVFYRYLTGHDLTFAEGLQVIAISFVLAYLSLRLVEQPARYGSLASSRLAIFGASGTAIVAAVTFGLVVTHLRGVPERLPAPVRDLYEATYDRSPFLGPDCFANTDGDGLSVEAVKAGKLCPLGAEGTNKVQFIVWGDSHAAAMAPAIDKAARKAGVSGLFVGRAGCPPVPNIDFGPASAVERCAQFETAVMSLIKEKKFPYVFMTGYWPRYVHRSDFPSENLFLDAAEMPGLDDWSAPLRAGLKQTLTTFDHQGTRAVLIMDVPEMGRAVPETLARAKMTGLPPEANVSTQYTLKRQALNHAVLNEAAKRHGSLIVDPMTAICDAQQCRSMVGDTVLYADSDHISAKGAETLAPLFAPIFAVITSPMKPVSVNELMN